MFDFAQIDWKLLREQKLHLLEAAAYFEHTPYTRQHKEWAKSLDGLVYLIDYIQDCAVDSGEYTKDQVFAFTRNEEGDVCDTCGGGGVVIEGEEKVPCPANCKVRADES